MPFESEIRSLGIELPSYLPGRYDALCPKCSSSRRKKNLKCLGVTIENDRFFGGCNHCSWTFPEKGFRGPKQPRNPDAGVFFAYGPDLRKYKNPPGREPRYYWRFRNIRNEWKAGTGGLKTDTLLYRFDELPATGTVLIVEGEKDADTCWRLGFPATCNAHGASQSDKKPKWTKAHSAQLRGRDLVVLNDHDDAGRAHAAAVCVCSLGIAASVKRLDLSLSWPEIKPGEDISDWAADRINSDNTAEQLRELIATATDYAPPVTAAQVAAAVQQAIGPAWLATCIMSDARIPRPLPNLANAAIGLEHDVAFAGKLSFNDMAMKSVFTNSEPKFVEDADISQMQEKLQHLGIKSLSKDITAQAIDHIARKKKFHPLRDTLDALTWDGVERIDEWLPTYLGTANTEYERKIGRLFLISMAARIYKPGIKADYMLILEGPQGDEKSKACAALAGEEYFSDHLPDLANAKDVSIHLLGKWLIEVPELHAFSKAEATLLKSFLSRQRELYRPPYGRMEVDQPRQCVFIGTSNKDTYLRDETGGRRFWPVKCGTILVDALKTDRDQLIAEAVYAFKAGEKHWPEREFERQYITPQQAARYEADIWSEKIETYLGEVLLAETVTVRAIANSALGIEDKLMDNRTEKRIVSVLQSLGWRSERTGPKGRFWRRPLSQ